MNSSTPVVIDREGISIRGKRHILLCASLFYFRIPSALWRDRIRKLRLAGYNCADVYFPWNHHETAPGSWQFEGEHDVDRFLSLMAEEGIHVVARPGPYICSEWDGGAIPAWHLTGGMPIRSADPKWLDAVQGWYDRILPILARHQLHRGGSVILVQVENELDFFDCPAPQAYMAALAGMARQAGIEVPIFGCAGQGSAEGATGFAPDVLPTYNFYPDPYDPGFDPVCLAVHRMLRERNLPFLITETGREHFLLRREMANGARLLGAYNQVGGTNFGLTASVNNWGRQGSPLSFITTDYDFASMIDPAGRFTEEALEGRLLGGLLDTLGEPLTTATVLDIREQERFAVAWERPVPSNGQAERVLEMGEEGRLLCVPNFSETPEVFTVRDGALALQVAVGARRAPFLPFDVPLAKAGVSARLAGSSAELLHMRDGAVLLYADEAAGITPVAVLAGHDGNELRVTGFGAHAIVLEGKRITVSLLRRHEAQRIDIGRGAFPHPVAERRPRIPLPAGSCRSIQLQDDWMRSCGDGRDGTGMERNGLYRGTADYVVRAAAGCPVVVMEAADLIRAWRGDAFLGTRISGCQWQRYDAASPRSLVGAEQPAGSQVAVGGERDSTVVWRFRTDSWGHSNFDDARLKSMRIASERGVAGLFQIDREDCGGLLWRFRQMETWLPETLSTDDTPFDAILPPNAWNTTRMPLVARYQLSWTLHPDSDACALWMENPVAETAVYVDGILAGLINPQDPWLDLSSWYHPGRTRTLSLLCRKRHWAEPAGVPHLYQMTRLVPQIRGFSGADLEAACPAGACVDKTLPVTALPGIRVAAGGTLQVQVPLGDLEAACRYLYLDMKDMKATVLFNGRLIGRVLGEGAGRPDMAGGVPNRLYLPEPWYRGADNLLTMLLEGLGADAELISAEMDA